MIGRYPIPAPSINEYAKIFGVRLEDVELDDADESAHAGDDDTSPKAMAIFELLDYIVNKVSQYYWVNLCKVRTFPSVKFLDIQEKHQFSPAFQTPPVLPRKVFSDHFVDFISKCLKKNLAERANQTVLMNDPFFKKYDALDDTTEFANWVQSVITM